MENTKPSLSMSRRNFLKTASAILAGAAAGRAIAVIIHAVRWVVLPGDRIAHTVARRVRNQHPGLKDARKFDDAKQQHQQERQDECKLNKCLTPSLGFWARSAGRQWVFFRQHCITPLPNE